MAGELYSHSSLDHFSHSLLLFRRQRSKGNITQSRVQLTWVAEPLGRRECPTPPIRRAREVLLRFPVTRGVSILVTGPASSVGESTLELGTEAENEEGVPSDVGVEAAEEEQEVGEVEQVRGTELMVEMVVWLCLYVSRARRKRGDDERYLNSNFNSPITSTRARARHPSAHVLTGGARETVPSSEASSSKNYCRLRRPLWGRLSPHQLLLPLCTHSPRQQASEREARA